MRTISLIYPINYAPMTDFIQVGVPLPTGGIGSLIAVHLIKAAWNMAPFKTIVTKPRDSPTLEFLPTHTITPTFLINLRRKEFVLTLRTVD